MKALCYTTQSHSSGWRPSGHLLLGKLTPVTLGSILPWEILDRGSYLCPNLCPTFWGQLIYSLCVRVQTHDPLAVI